MNLQSSVRASMTSVPEFRWELSFGACGRTTWTTWQELLNRRRGTRMSHVNEEPRGSSKGGGWGGGGACLFWRCALSEWVYASPPTPTWALGNSMRKNLNSLLD